MATFPMNVSPPTPICVEHDSMNVPAWMPLSAADIASTWSRLQPGDPLVGLVQLAAVDRVPAVARPAPDTPIVLPATANDCAVTKPLNSGASANCTCIVLVATSHRSGG
ncbi:MAG: hypothetical protein HGB15_04625 [Chlorobaculum sp.]|nr:hypothetical protein [Chlorobaculum sp.]